MLDKKTPMMKSNRIKYIDKKCRHVIKVSKILDKYIATKKYINDFEDMLDAEDETTQFPSLKRLLKKEFNNVKHLGGGCSRTVYQLTRGIVLKLDRNFYCYPEDDGGGYNKNELKACLRAPTLTAKPYLHYVDTSSGINVLIARRAKAVKSLNKDPKIHKRYKLLENKFDDLHKNNVGFVKGKLVAIDLGHECT